MNAEKCGLRGYLIQKQYLAVLNTDYCRENVLWEKRVRQNNDIYLNWLSARKLSTWNVHLVKNTFRRLVKPGCRTREIICKQT